MLIEPLTRYLLNDQRQCGFLTRHRTSYVCLPSPVYAKLRQRSRHPLEGPIVNVNNAIP
jgi:hypothetical protein